MDSEEFWKDDLQWENPAKQGSRRPFLADLTFPNNPTTPTYEDSVRVLKHFYCDDREAFQSDLAKLNNYLAAPNEQIFIIEGEAGIGKTWFTRYHLLMDQHAAASPVEKPPFYSGVIDLLASGALNVEDAIYRQMAPLLEHYVRTYIKGGVPKLLTQYAEHKWADLFGADSAVSTQEKYARLQPWVNEWVDLGQNQLERRRYVELLLSALESMSMPKLFLVIDNVDQLPEDEQIAVIDLVARILKHVHIRLIIPLRETSTFLRSRFNGLLKRICDDMPLSKLKMRSMLAKRFSSTEKCEPLDNHTITDPRLKRKTTYPKLFNRIFGQEPQTDAPVGRLIERLANGNCRVAIQTTRRLLESDQLKDLRNIGNLQYAIAAWMFTDKSEPYTPVFVNLFDPGEGSPHGQALVRYRLLELMIKDHHIGFEDRRLKIHFEWLGYKATLYRQALISFMEGAVIRSRSRMTPEQVMNADGALGGFELTDTGRCYWDTLLLQKWYYVAVKRQLERRLDGRYLSRDERTNRRYASYTSFIEFLAEEYEEEQHRRKLWERINGRKTDFTLHVPHEVAKRYLMSDGAEDTQQS